MNHESSCHINDVLACYKICWILIFWVINLRSGHSDAEQCSSDDDDEPAAGLMSVLKGYTNAPKASAKAKAKPTPKPSVRNKASTSSQPSAANLVSMKNPIGSVDSLRGKKRRTEHQTGKESTKPAPAVSVSMSDELCDADKEICDGFRERLSSLRVVNPPLSDPQFKAYINDVLSKCTTFLNDVKTKRRSAQRRSNKDDMLTANLDMIEDEMQQHVHILKCFLGFFLCEWNEWVDKHCLESWVLIDLFFKCLWFLIVFSCNCNLS